MKQCQVTALLGNAIGKGEYTLIYKPTNQTQTYELEGKLSAKEEQEKKRKKKRKQILWKIEQKIHVWNGKKKKKIKQKKI